MKILYLNAWNAEVREPLTIFLKANIPDTDVFCFQEAESNLVALCANLLKEYIEVSGHKYVREPDDFYVSTYVKNTCDIISTGQILENENDIGLGIFVRLKQDEVSLYVCNFHGMSRPIDKHDTPGRQRQVQGLIEFFKSKNSPQIIGGDFNVFPSNESIQQFRKAGYRDLIKDFGITNTRNRLIWEKYPDNPKQYFSDYVFVSEGVRIKSFAVPAVEVSDHQPLVLEIEL